MFSLNSFLCLVLFPVMIKAANMKLDKCSIPNFDGCNYPGVKFTQISKQTLDSDGKLTQFLPSGTEFKLAKDGSTVIQYDSVILDTDGSTELVTNDDGSNQLIFRKFSKISK